MERQSLKTEQQPGESNLTDQMKVTDSITATGKGRGRPKKQTNKEGDLVLQTTLTKKASPVPRGRGRPKKYLKFSRNGCKLGRPKSAITLAKPLSDGAAKQLGRPLLGKDPYVPTGKSRGRPKLATNVKKSALGVEKNAGSSSGDSSMDEDDKEKLIVPIASSSSKSRGRQKRNVSIGNKEVTDEDDESDEQKEIAHD